MNADIHVEVEHDLEDEMEMDISDNKEEDVVRCLCDVFEDSGLMIQVQLCLPPYHVPNTTERSETPLTNHDLTYDK